jgi:hypothetical protein
MITDHDSYDYLIADNRKQIACILHMEKIVLDPPDRTPPVALDMEDDDDHCRLIGELIGQILGPGNDLSNLLQI